MSKLFAKTIARVIIKPMEQIPKIIKKVSPAVVAIVLVKPNKEVPEENREKDGFVELETGSGFFVSDSGLVVTNRHVVFESAGDYWIFWNNKKYFAEVLSRDPINDFAILKINANVKTPFFELADTSKLLLGETVIAIGNVLGNLQKTVSAGIVSGLSRNIMARDESYNEVFELRGLIQTDAAINPGNSGGPLVDLSGRAIGINTATISEYENIGFAIPAGVIKEDIETIKKQGKLNKPYLGIRYIILDKELKKEYGLPVDYGAYILREPEPDGEGVISGSPADRAGLKEGDIILEVDGKKISRRQPLKEILRLKESRQPISLKILRNKTEIDAQASLLE